MAGTAEYSLSDILDVYIDGHGLAGTIIPSSGAETPVRAITRADYIAISSKDIQSTPTLVFVERLAVVKLVFWPVPVATCSFRFQKIRYPRDMDTGARTLDLSKRWQKAIVYTLAAQLALAKSAPLERVQFLESRAEQLKEKARASESDMVPMQLYVVRG